MSRKLVYIFSLAGFFLMWGLFGFAAGAPRGEPGLQATMLPADSTAGIPAATNSPRIPVTGEPEPVLTEIIVFYGLIGFTALFLILALLNIANKPAAPGKRPESRTPNERNRK